MLDSLMIVGLSVLSLGSIHEADGPVERTFWLRNSGPAAVTLLQGYTSCGCTTIHCDQGQTLAPGDSSCVILSFNPRGKGGEFHETGTVVYSSQPSAGIQPGRSRVSLSMVGNCITSEETLLRQFPIRVSDTLRLSANRFDLGIMHVGERKERGVVVLHRGSHDRQERLPVVFTATDECGKGLLHLPYALKIGDQTVTVTLDVIIK